MINEPKRVAAPRWFWLCVLFAGPGSLVEAELRNVEVGGTVEIYGAYYSDFFADRNRTIWPDFYLSGRALGVNGTETYVDNDGRGNNIGFVEQRTKLRVRADFSRDVSAFLELDSVWNWGEDFRSDYLTGSDRRAQSNNGDPEIFQAYVETNELFGYPARLRIGRQTLSFGNEWLVGTNSDPDPFIEVSFDAARLTFENGPVTTDIWAATLGEAGGSEQDGDTTFYGVYVSWAESPALTLDVYYMFLRDARSVNDTNFVAPLERVENLVGLDNYDATTLHTAGLRIAGEWQRFDYYAEAAYQWGEADALGSQFRFPGQLYGDDDARYGAFAGVFEIGYTFDSALQPRVYIAGAYFGSDDRRDRGFSDFVNPFDRPEASAAFNRLFSSYRPTHFLDYSALSNFWLLRAGIEATITDRFSVSLDVMNYRVVEPFDAPYFTRVGSFRIPAAPALSFWTDEGDDDLGVEIMLAPRYDYSEDLAFSMQLVYYFVGDAFDSGVFLDENANRFIGGTGSEDAASVTFLATLSF